MCIFLFVQSNKSQWNLYIFDMKRASNNTYSFVVSASESKIELENEWKEYSKIKIILNSDCDNWLW